jgi:hypothetical protein
MVFWVSASTCGSTQAAQTAEGLGVVVRHRDVEGDAL